MAMVVLDYERKRRGPWRGGKRLWGIIFGVLLLGYVAGYAKLRVDHVFIRDMTYYTGDSGRIVRTDRIRLGDGRFELTWIALEEFYGPLRVMEAWYWRLKHW
jgi:hypothetical protein